MTERRSHWRRVREYPEAIVQQKRSVKVMRDKHIFDRGIKSLVKADEYEAFLSLHSMWKMQAVHDASMLAKRVDLPEEEVVEKIKWHDPAETKLINTMSEPSKSPDFVISLHKLPQDPLKREQRLLETQTWLGYMRDEQVLRSVPETKKPKKGIFNIFKR